MHPLHENVQQGCVQEEAGADHREVLDQLTLHRRAVACERPLPVQGEVDAVAGDEPDDRRDEVPYARPLRESVQQAVVQEETNPSCKQEAQKLVGFVQEVLLPA